MATNTSTAVRWIDQGRPGYFGRHRDEMISEYDQKYGKGNWKLEWAVGSLRYNFLDVCKVYEEAYFRFLLASPAVLERLINEASDVYDTDPSNMKSGLDYSAQEGGRTHIQDIAIRNVLHRMELEFKGHVPIQIRQELGPHPLSMTLSPGRVPFHLPQLIVKPELEGWWNPGTVESFYQSNKILVVKESAIRQRA